MANNISSYIECNNVLSEVQGGFRKDHRCEDHIFSLKGIAAARLAENKNTYMAFLDFRKAFDTVWRNGLLSVAWNIGIRGKTWKILNGLYQWRSQDFGTRGAKKTKSQICRLKNVWCANCPPPSSLETWIEMYFWKYMANLSQMHSWKCAF